MRAGFNEKYEEIIELLTIAVCELVNGDIAALRGLTDRVDGICGLVLFQIANGN